MKDKTKYIYSDSTLKQMTRKELIEHIKENYDNIYSLQSWKERVIEVNTKLVALLNEYQIEWIEETQCGYRVKEIKKGTNE